MMKIFVIFFFTFTVIHHANSFVCSPNICSIIKCVNATPKTCFEPNQEIRDGACGCCKICYINLDEGEECPPFTRGQAPPSSGCKKGLKCTDGKCSKI